MQSVLLPWTMVEQSRVGDLVHRHVPMPLDAVLCCTASSSNSIICLLEHCQQEVLMPECLLIQYIDEHEILRCHNRTAGGCCPACALCIKNRVHCCRKTYLQT